MKEEMAWEKPRRRCQRPAGGLAAAGHQSALRRGDCWTWEDERAVQEAACLELDDLVELLAVGEKRELSVGGEILDVVPRRKK